MQRPARRALAAVATAAMAMAGLSGCTIPFLTPISAATITPTPLPAAPSTSSPLMAPSGPVPALANTGTQWAPMLSSLLTYGQWLLANPSPAAVGMVANVGAAGCPLTDQLSNQVVNLSGENWRLAPSPLTLSSLGTPTTLAAGETTVTLSLQASRAAEPIVDPSGGVASQVAALPLVGFDVTLLLGGDGKWRLCSVVPNESGAPAGTPSLF
jgi:hypothetical protein